MLLYQLYRCASGPNYSPENLISLRIFLLATGLSIGYIYPPEYFHELVATPVPRSVFCTHFD
jgi:hypothetical protein